MYNVKQLLRLACTHVAGQTIYAKPVCTGFADKSKSGMHACVHVGRGFLYQWGLSGEGRSIIDIYGSINGSLPWVYMYIVGYTRSIVGVRQSKLRLLILCFGEAKASNTLRGVGYNVHVSCITQQITQLLP